jgi:hypothetical protein
LENIFHKDETFNSPKLVSGIVLFVLGLLYWFWTQHASTSAVLLIFSALLFVHPSGSEFDLVCSIGLA